MSNEKKRIKSNIAYYNRAKNNARAVIEFRRNNKIKLIQFLGGKCEKCGYNKKCLSAYHFHHKNKEEKSYTISRYMSRNLETLLAEAKKCSLLCSNCHAELHDEENGMIRENTIKRWENFTPEKIKELSIIKKSKAVKKSCLYCKNSYRPGYPTQQFCSRKCKIEHINNVVAPENLEQLLNEIGIEQIARKFIVPKTKVIKWLVERNLYTNKVCPTCNSLFYTEHKNQIFCSIKCVALSPSRRKVKDRPSNESITEMLKTMSMVSIGKKYGVSDNAVRKWMKADNK